MTLTWDDGSTTRIELTPLRARCPCAACRTRRDQGAPVVPSTPVQIVDAEIVGGWGLGVTWSDGHSTGIYSWELLRRA